MRFHNQIGEALVIIPISEEVKHPLKFLTSLVSMFPEGTDNPNTLTIFHMAAILDMACNRTTVNKQQSWILEHHPSCSLLSALKVVK